MKKRIVKKDRNQFSRKGVTLIEMTVVIVVLLIIISISVVSTSFYRDWSLGSRAAHSLRVVYNAQRSFLAENPRMQPSQLTVAAILPYASPGTTTADLLTVEGPDGGDLTIDVTIVPPVIAGFTDPSGSTTDGLWDVGSL